MKDSADIVLSNLIAAIDIITPLSHKSVLEAVELMYILKIVDDNIFKDGESKLYKRVLAIGLGPRESKALSEAIDISCDPKIVSLRPWVL